MSTRTPKMAVAKRAKVKGVIPAAVVVRRVEALAASVVVATPGAAEARRAARGTPGTAVTPAGVTGAAIALAAGAVAGGMTPGGDRYDNDDHFFFQTIIFFFYEDK